MTVISLSGIFLIFLYRLGIKKTYTRRDLNLSIRSCLLYDRTLTLSQINSKQSLKFKIFVIDLVSKIIYTAFIQLMLALFSFKYLIQYFVV